MRKGGIVGRTRGSRKGGTFKEGGWGKDEEGGGEGSVGKGPE